MENEYQKGVRHHVHIGKCLLGRSKATSVTVDMNTASRRVLVFGATGTAGQGAVRALVAAGHEVTCFVRTPRGVASDIIGDVTAPAVLNRHFDVVVSCLASRSGAPKDAWAVDHGAHLRILDLAQEVGATHFILLSAICVQKPLLPFQQAKLAFEAALVASGMTYSIIRPTAFFKSLSGQIDRVRQGKPFLVFGDGALTACKPLSDDDLGRFIAGCIADPMRHNRILPIGGPGAAMTPMQQGHLLFALLGMSPKFRHVPVGLLDVIQRGLALAGILSPRLAAKAELARIGRYYATESMLVLDPVTGCYDADATPATGTDTLEAHYASVIAGDTQVHRGDHAVF